jgi:D-sedoheptulose 7-phosphate isomerase
MKTMQEKILKSVRDHTIMLEVFHDRTEDIGAFAERVVEVFNHGGKLLVMGTGSMGAVAGLVATQFLHRLSLERPLLPAIALCHDMTLATALARDGGTRQFFSRQLQAIAAPDDVVLAFGTAQPDDILEEGLVMARQLGCLTAAVLQGKGEAFGEIADFHFRLETESTPRAAEGALFFGNLLCELVEGALFGI